jgi:hypothetical protein
MTETLDRRNPKVARVELATLVDICARDRDLPPFQGKSGNISGRGMHVRTSHLPEIGTPLVCRFEHSAREVLVEGRVAWRSEGDDGGEFGVQFTAVDADSSEILRSLRPMSSVSSAFKPKTSVQTVTADDDDDDDDEQLLLKSGDRVRLHIEGLAAPMKASVHDSSSHKVRLGSKLEFLKVGRPVEIESVDEGGRRGAKVDSVNVVMNPSTSVPELVVMLRYEGETAAPAEARDEDHEPTQMGDSEDLGDEFGPLADATDALKAKMQVALGKAQGAFMWAKGAALRVGNETKRGVQAARDKMQESAENPRTTTVRPAKVMRSQAPRRTAHPHRPSNISRAGLGSKRPSVAPSAKARAGAPVPETKRANRAFVLGGAALLGALFLGSFALKGRGDAAVSRAEPNAASPTSTTPAPVQAPAAPSPAATAAAPPPKQNAEGIVAEVPLFGSRPIATAEPLSKTTESEALAEKRAAAASVPDEKFPPAQAEPARDTQSSWGRGQLTLPTVHRIRLDAAGSEVVGVAEPNGFAVVIPGRKAMETGRAIEKRDRRLLKVSTSNTAEGARINFSFRGPVPPYRVRLKNDFVEFFVSAPEGLQAEPYRAER